MHRPCALLLSLLFATLSPVALAAGLPDTGQALCDDGTNALVACSNTNSGDASTMPRQDGRFGRDPAAGGTGFDYTKVCNSGEPAGSGSCPADPALGTGANDWACTQDNITGLMWEVKVDDGTLRDRDWMHTWYDSNTSTNGGNAGSLGTDTCGGTLSGYSNQCNTEHYVTAVNAVTLCGSGDWRLPSKRELQTLTHLGNASLTIDTAWFPNAQPSNFWSASSYVPFPIFAWNVSFGNGSDFPNIKENSSYVRLVRGGQF